MHVGLPGAPGLLCPGGQPAHVDGAPAWLSLDDQLGDEDKGGPQGLRDLPVC